MLSAAVLYEEFVSRYVVYKGNIRQDGSIRHQEIWPDEKRGYKTSIFRIDGLPDNAIWALGDHHVGTDQRPVLARLDLNARTIYEQALNFEVDNTPPRHANIVGWPTDRSHFRSIAQQVAAKGISHQK